MIEFSFLGELKTIKTSERHPHPACHLPSPVVFLNSHEGSVKMTLAVHKALMRDSDWSSLAVKLKEKHTPTVSFLPADSSAVQ